MSEGRQVVLVTGASSGIGSATATLLAERGHRVFGTSRSPAGAATPAGVEMLELDVRSDASVAACVEALLARAGRIDAVVNNAGVVLFGESEGVSIDQAKEQFETNVFGTIRVVNAVLPAMRRQGRGRIVNMSSLVGLTGVPLLALYSASKFAIEGYSESLRYELRDFGISVSLVEPGWVRTALGEAAERPAAPVSAYDRMRRAALAAVGDRIEHGLPPARVAEAILRAVGDPKPRLRYRVGREATWIPRVRVVAPQARFEETTRRMFGLGAAPGRAGDRGRAA
jgi:NAD(P)-dependent dehydrogenase (short-subunit alcohol dehydrogenase family)